MSCELQSWSQALSPLRTPSGDKLTEDSLPCIQGTIYQPCLSGGLAVPADHVQLGVDPRNRTLREWFGLGLQFSRDRVPS